MERTYDKYIVWTDSVKALTAEDKLGALQQKYDQSLQTIQEKDDKLSVKQYMIVGLITFVVILIAALLFLGFLLLTQQCIFKDSFENETSPSEVLSCKEIKENHPDDKRA